jgi:hypothetical protein
MQVKSSMRAAPRVRKMKAFPKHRARSFQIGRSSCVSALVTPPALSRFPTPSIADSGTGEMEARRFARFQGVSQDNEDGLLPAVQFPIPESPGC